MQVHNRKSVKQQAMSLRKLAEDFKREIQLIQVESINYQEKILQSLTPEESFTFIIFMREFLFI